MTAGLRIQVRGTAKAARALQQLGRPRRDLMEAIGAVVEGQTRFRIGHDKESPEGTPWPPWSEAYAATRHAGHSLGQDTNAMLDSIQFAATDDKVEVGSPQEYAGFFHVMREFLGLGRQDRDEVAQAITDFQNRIVRGVA